jgi:hypothetical protein
MAVIIAGLLQFIPLVPGIVASIEQLISRGKQSGELSPADADALTTLSQSIFMKYSQPAPPPPGVQVPLAAK